MDLIVRLDDWFASRLEGLEYPSELKAYVVGVLARRKWDDADLSTESVVLAYRDAVASIDFAAFQRVGDWVLFVDAVHPRHLDGVRESVQALGRNAYYTCHRMVRGKWGIYERLGDELPSIVRSVRHRLV